MIDIRETVAQQAKKWEQLNALLHDSEIYSFLTEHFGRQNGYKPDIAVPKVNAGASYVVATALEPTIKRRKGEFMDAVEKACNAMPTLPIAFSAGDVFKLMRDGGFRFTGSGEPVVAVGQAMRKLADRERSIKVSSLGSGRRPTRYHRIGGN